MSKFTVGFVFDEKRENVLLVHKTKPAWQNGKINGLGGKIEECESVAACVARECEEETTLVIPADKWLHFATVHQPDGNVEFLVVAYGGDPSDARKGDYEAVEWFPVHHLPATIIPNLSFLIPAGKLVLEGYHLTHLDVHYPHD